MTHQALNASRNTAHLRADHIAGPSGLVFRGRRMAIDARSTGQNLAAQALDRAPDGRDPARFSRSSRRLMSG